MKFSHIACATLASLTLISGAQAAELTVKGEITAPACNINIENAGVLIWDNIPHSDLSTTDFLLLPVLKARLVINCQGDSQTSFAVKMDKSDNSETPGGGGNHNDPERIFGLGYDPRITGNKLGNFTMVPTNGFYDGFISTRLGTGERGQASEYYSQTALQTNKLAVRTNTNEYTLLDSTRFVPALANEFIFEWDVEPALNIKSAITSTETVPFEGKAILTVRYL